MELIQSFSVDHTAIVPGIFVSRVDTIGSGTATTYDIRLKKPNREPVIDVAAMHSLEHIIATYLRNILKGTRSPREIYDLLLSAFKSVDDAQVVPGATAVNCGHYLMHNLGMAKWYAAEFASYLEANAGKDEIFEYPRTERLVTDEGQQFFDS